MNLRDEFLSAEIKPRAQKKIKNPPKAVKTGGNYMIIVHAYVELKEGKETAFISAAKNCIEETRKESGNISYELNTSIESASKLIFVEKWQSREALTAHTKTEHYLKFKEVSADFRAKPSSVEIYTSELSE